VRAKRKKIVAVDAILIFRKKNSSTLFLLDVPFKCQVSIDLYKNWLSYGKFMLGGHLGLVRHFIFFDSIFYDLIIGSTLNQIANGIITASSLPPSWITIKGKTLLCFSVQK
jgi:hypothetical protein